MKKVLFIVMGCVVLLVIAAVAVPKILMRLNQTNSFIQERDREANKPFTFYARIVDQDGNPLEGARIDLIIIAYNENWAWTGNSANRGANYNANCTSDAMGNIKLEGHGESLYIHSIERDGYEWLTDRDVGQDAVSPFGPIQYFYFHPNGHPDYLSDPKRPAIFVMVKQGETVVHIAPSPGGYRKQHYVPGPPEVLQPVFPRQPSIPCVRYEPLSTSAPATLTG